MLRLWLGLGLGLDWGSVRFGLSFKIIVRVGIGFVLWLWLS